MGWGGLRLLCRDTSWGEHLLRRGRMTLIARGHDPPQHLGRWLGRDIRVDTGDNSWWAEVAKSTLVIRILSSLPDNMDGPSPEQHTLLEGTAPHRSFAQGISLLSYALRLFSYAQHICPCLKLAADKWVTEEVACLSYPPCHPLTE